MKRFVCILMALSMCLLFVLPASSSGQFVERGKISEALLNELEQVDMNEELDVYIIMYDLEYDEVMDEFKRMYPEEYSEYMMAKWGSHEEIEAHGKLDVVQLKAAIEAKRGLFEELYHESNQSFIDRYAEKEKQLFVSRCSPMIIATMSKAKIIEVSELEEIAYLDLFVNAKCEPDLAIANNLSGAKKVRDTYGCKGKDVIIGQIEPGLPDTSNSDLTGVSITTHGSCSNSGYNTHATAVARIMVGNNNGVAPDAALCAAAIATASDFYNMVETLIVQDSVNVINMSAGFDNSLGLYDMMSRWVDHIAINHDVHFVKTAGNRNIAADDYDGLINSPGMAYNAITVGGFYDYNNNTPEDDIRYNASSFLEAVAQNRPEKPNLVADAKNVLVGTNHSGTSFAAPQVTGVIAQLCSYDEALLLRQTEMGAMLMAGAAYKLEGTTAGHHYCGFQTSYCVENHTSGDKNKQISVFEGAGKLNAEKTYKIAVDNTHYKATIKSSDFSYTKTVTLTASSSMPARIAIFWLKRNSFPTQSGSHLPDSNQLPSTFIEPNMSNLNLRVYAPSGIEKGYSTTKEANFEVVQFLPSETGTYRIVISKSGSNNSEKEYVGIAVLK